MLTLFALLGQRAQVGLLVRRLCSSLASSLPLLVCGQLESFQLSSQGLVFSMHSLRRGCHVLQLLRGLQLLPLQLGGTHFCVRPLHLSALQRRQQPSFKAVTGAGVQSHLVW